MRYFFDTEFIENGKTIELLSIGIVAGDGREFYRICADTDVSKANDWVKVNVLTQLNTYLQMPPVTHQQLRQDILEFIGEDKDPHFYAYYADYDWVVLCQLFGTMMDLPEGWPMYCRDIKQYCDFLGNPRLPKQGKGEHNALADARWAKLAFEFLKGFMPDADW